MFGEFSDGFDSGEFFSSVPCCTVILGGQLIASHYVRSNTGKVTTSQVFSTMATNDVGESYDTTGLLSDSQLQDLRSVFDLFDTNGNGTISAKELGTIMRSIGQDPTEAELQDMINDRDSDGSGTLDFLEFVNLMGAPMKGDDVNDDVDATFRAWCDSNGNITVDNLAKALQAMGEKCDRAELEEMIREADSQFRSNLGDGSIQLEEFRALLKSH